MVYRHKNRDLERTRTYDRVRASIPCPPKLSPTILQTSNGVRKMNDIIYDVVYNVVYDVVYDIVHKTSYTILYTISYLHRM